MASQEDTVLVDPRQNGPVGMGLYALGVAQVIGAAWVLLAADEQSMAARLILVLVLAVSGLLFLQVGRLVHEPKGGLIWVGAARRFRLAGARANDVLEIPVEEIHGVAVASRTESWGREGTAVEVGAVELVLNSGATVLVAEPGNQERADEIAGGLREITGLPEVSAPSTLSPRQREHRLRLGPGAPLGMPLATAGILFLGVGGMMIANIQAAPVFGFLFGPTIAIMGLAFLALAMGKAMSSELVQLSSETWRHEVLLAGRRIYSRSGGGADVPVRVRVASRGGQGFCLHLISGGSVEVVLNGVSRRTRVVPSALLSLAADLAGDVRSTKEKS